MWSESLNFRDWGKGGPGLKTCRCLVFYALCALHRMGKCEEIMLEKLF